MSGSRDSLNSNPQQKIICLQRQIDEYKEKMAIYTDINKTLKQEVKEKSTRLKSLNEQLIFAEEMERKTIASDLHDGVVQTLAIGISRLKDIKDSTGIIKMETLSKIQYYLEQSVREIRALIYQLSPPILDDFDIETALGFLIEESNIEHHGNIQYINHIQDPVMFDKTIKIVLYRAVNELITNIFKHSGAKNAKVEIFANKNIMRIKIEDDGIGFCTENINHKFYGFGLSSLGERMKNIGGNMKIFSEPGNGTRIVLLAPFN